MVLIKDLPGKQPGETERDYYYRKDKDIAEHSSSIYYSKRYNDEEFEYRHVMLPKQLVRYVPENRLMPEEEWRALGVVQSPGWIHYMKHGPEPHILLFRRSIKNNSDF